MGRVGSGQARGEARKAPGKLRTGVSSELGKAAGRAGRHDAGTGRVRALSGLVKLEMMSKNPNGGRFKDKLCVSVRCDRDRGRECAGANVSASHVPTACISSQLHAQ